MTIHDYTHEMIEAIVNTAKLDSLTKHKIVRKIHSLKMYKDFKTRKLEEVKLQKHKRPTAPMSFSSLPASVKEVIKIACDKHEIDIHEFCSNRRLTDIIDCQRQVIYLLHKEFKYSCTKVALWFIEDHSTILHSCKKHCDLVETNRMYARLYQVILEQTNEKAIFVI